MIIYNCGLVGTIMVVDVERLRVAKNIPSVGESVVHGIDGVQPQIELPLWNCKKNYLECNKKKRIPE